MADVTSVAAAKRPRTLEDMNRKTREPVTELGKDQFLSLLAAQLANQDPLEPTKDTDFIAQMASFTSLEQMSQLNSAMLASQASGLVGKWVTYGKDGEYGKVESVTIQGGISYLNVNGKSLALGDVTGIVDTPQEDGYDIVRESSVIGKTVTAKWVNYELDADGNRIQNEDGSYKTIEYSAAGKVASLVYGKEDGLLYAVLDDANKTMVYVGYISEMTA